MFERFYFHLILIVGRFCTFSLKVFSASDYYYQLCNTDDATQQHEVKLTRKCITNTFDKKALVLFGNLIFKMFATERLDQIYKTRIAIISIYFPKDLKTSSQKLLFRFQPLYGYFAIFPKFYRLKNNDVKYEQSFEFNSLPCFTMGNSVTSKPVVFKRNAVRQSQGYRQLSLSIYSCIQGYCHILIQLTKGASRQNRLRNTALDYLGNPSVSIRRSQHFTTSSNLAKYVSKTWFKTKYN